MPPLGSVYAPVAEAACDLTPLTGVVSIGQVTTCEADGLNIPVAGGSRAVLVYSATATGNSITNTLSGYWAASLTLQ